MLSDAILDEERRADEKASLEDLLRMSMCVLLSGDIAAKYIRSQEREDSH